jgi:small subunit ribosomal protein S8
MITTDPIADLLTRIRNGHMANHERVDVPYSKLKERIVEILKREGYIKNFKPINSKSSFQILRIYLRYDGAGRPSINGIKRVSKPGRRVYLGKSELPEVLKGLGISILTTNQGVMTSRRAKELGIGGEILCNVW